MTLLIVLTCIFAWFFVGYLSGTWWARHAYAANKYADFGASDARMAMGMGLLGGPITFVCIVFWLFVKKITRAAVPQLNAALYKEEVAAQEKRLKDLQRQIDSAHAELGLPPLKF